MNLGLLGKDIKYSLSPKIFKKISKILNIKINYTLIDEEKEVFDEIINNLRLGILDGLNITKPYKEKIIKYCDYVSEEAFSIGAVNTLVSRNGKIHGFNTDLFGFGKLFDYFNSLEKEIYIFGNGASAKMIANFLESKNRKFKIVKRSVSSRKKISENEIYYNQLPSSNGLVINSSIIGTDKNHKSMVSDSQLCNKEVIDLVYNYKETIYMRKSKRGINGLIMLIIQALKSFEIWSKEEIQIDQLFKIIKGEIVNELNW